MDMCRCLRLFSGSMSISYRLSWVIKRASLARSHWLSMRFLDPAMVSNQKLTIKQLHTEFFWKELPEKRASGQKYAFFQLLGQISIQDKIQPVLGKGLLFDTDTHDKHLV